MAGKSSALHLPKAYVLKMKQLPTYKWWKPLVAFLLAFVFFFLFSIVLEVAYSVFVAAKLSVIGAEQGLTPEQIVDALQTYGNSDAAGSYLGIDESDPVALIHSFLSLALIIPSIGLACKIMKIGGLRGLSSVEGGLRWKRIAVLFPWAALVVIVFCAVEIGIGMALGDDLGEIRFVPAAIIVILLLCPLQCAAEEYMCRGFFMQAFGSWIPITVIPIILQALVFTVLHGYNLLGLIGICAMGLIAGYLTVKTGGLEASICIHAANNIQSFILSALFVSATTQVDVTAQALVTDLLLTAAFLVVMYLVSKRKGYFIEDEPASPAAELEA